MNNLDRLDVAIFAAQEAGKILLEYRDGIRGDLKSALKPDGSMVTEADHKASAKIHEILNLRDPGTYVLDEEVPQDHADSRPERMWIVDPLDGTSLFQKGSKNFCVLIALLEQDQPRLGVIYFPTSSTIYYGNFEISRAWVEEEGKAGKRIRGVKHRELDIRMCMGIPRNPQTMPRYKQLANAIGVQAVVDDPSGRMYGRMLSGGLHMVVTLPGHPSVWDVAAGHALLRCVGGEILDLAGNPINYKTDTSLTNGSIAVMDRRLLPTIIERLSQTSEISTTSC